MNANILKKSQIILFITFSLFLVSCNKGCYGNKLDVNVESIPVQLNYARFDLELIQCKNSADIDHLRLKYPAFYNDYVFKVMRFAPVENDSFCTAKMLDLAANVDFRNLFDSTQKVFQDDAIFRAGLTDAMKHFKYYFTNDSVPQFITFNSFFMYQNIVGDDYIGIGLDMYLGKDYVYYTDSRLDFPRYLIEKFNKNFLIRNTLKYFIEQHFEIVPSNIFIERAVQQGKIYFLLDALCPEMPDSIKIQYSLDQLNWMKLVEKEMWVDFVNRKVLFSKSAFDNDKYFTDGPFTNAPSVSRDSPPRVGEWLGWQIVKKYMDTHSNVTVKQLMDEKDLMKIYKDSGYRPK